MNILILEWDKIMREALVNMLVGINDISIHAANGEEFYKVPDMIAVLESDLVLKNISAVLF